MGKGIRELNEAKQKGHVEFTEEDGVVQVGLTDAGRQAAEKVLEQINGEVGTQHHGINDYEENPITVPRTSRRGRTIQPQKRSSSGP